MNEPQPDSDDVIAWFRALETDDQDAARKLWEHCFPRLVRYSRTRLPPHLRKALDEEDVALSAFKSLCEGARDGSLQTVQNRDELWKLLTCITARKACGYARHETRQRRGGGKVRGESIFSLRDANGPQSGRNSADGLAQQSDSADSPEMLVEFADQCQSLIDTLEDDILQTIALLRLEGYSVQEIADRMNSSKRSVERRLNLIRQIWTTDGTT